MSHKILLIDNYDSFTYNLLQYLAELSAEVEVKRNDQITLEEIEARMPDGIVISPGPCTPREAGISIDLVKRFSGRVPILGVCLGHQSIAMAFGGEVDRAAEIMHGKTSEITHDQKGVFGEIPNPCVATRYHSLIVPPATLPDELYVTATVKGEDTVMGIRHREHPTEGVQFHPESILTVDGHRLLQNFLDTIEKTSV